MAYRRIIAGATSQMVEFCVYDSSSSTGALLTGLVYNTASLTAYYNRQNAAGSATAISLVTMTKGTWTSGGFIAVDATNMPGVYQLCLPDAAVAAASGVKFVTVVLKGAANMVPVVLEIELQQEVDMAVNATQILGTAISTPATAGILDVNIKNIANAAVSTSTAQLGVNIVNAAGTAWASGAITDSVFAAATYPKAIRTATAQASAAGYITLDASASATDNLYVGCSIKIVSGTGAGQSRTIIMYIGSTKLAYVDRVWITTPSTDSVFVINSGKLTADVVDVGIAQAGAGSTITLASTSSAVNDYYDGAMVQIISGTGLGQSRIIKTYVGASKLATVSDGWGTNPDNTSVYIVRGLGDVEVGINNDKTGYSLANGSIVAATFAANAIDANAIADNAIDAGAIASNAITSAKIATDAIGAAQIAADAIGSSEFAQAAADKVWSSAARTLTSFGTLVSDIWSNSTRTLSAFSTTLAVSVWDVLTANIATANSIGKKLIDWLAGTDTSTPTVNITKIDGASLSTHTSGMIPADARDILGTAISTPATAGILDVNVKNINNAAVSTSVAQIGVNAVNIGGTAQTGRDLGASVLLSPGTGTGQISLSSGAVTVGTNNDKTGYTVSTVSDKTGYALSSSGIQAIWDALTSAFTTVGSIGKKLKDWVLGTDNKVILSADTQTGVTIPTVTTLTNAPTGMALDSTVAKEATLNTKIPTALSFTGANVNAESKVTAAPADMALDSTVMKAASYTAPDNTGIGNIYNVVKSGGTGDNAAIKTQTDKMQFDVSNNIKSVKNATTAGTADFNATEKASITSAAGGEVTLAASQPNYAPSKAGDAMTLTSAYDAAKTASQFNPASDTVTLKSGTHTGAVVPTVTNITNDVGITQAGADKVWGTTVRTLSSYGTLVADIATAVWGATTRTLSSFGTLISDIWANATRSLTDKSGFAPTAGDIDTQLSGTHGSGAWDATGSAPTVQQIRTEMDTNSVKLDVAVSTRLAAASYTAPANSDITAIKAKTDNLPSNPASQTNLDVAVSTRLASAGYTAPDNAGIASVKSKTDNLPTAPAATGDAMTLTSGERSNIATAVWSATTRTLTAFGSLISDIWSATTRSLTDKIGFSISGTKQTLDALNDVSASTIDTQLSSSHGSGSWDATAVSVNINDNTGNKLIIAKALKDQDVSGTSPVTGSIYKGILDQIDTVPTVEEIDTELSDNHGSGDWDAVSTNVTLSDSNTNKTIIAKSLKDQDVSAVTPSTGSVYKGLSDQIDAVPTSEEIDVRLSYSHGSGAWDGILTSVNINDNAGNKQIIRDSMAVALGSVTIESGSIDAKLDSIITGGGIRTVTIITKLADNTRVSGVLVYIKNISGTVITSATTDSNGSAVVNLDDGTYSIVSYKAMYVIANVPITITEDTTVDILCVSVAPPTPPPLGLQTVYGNVRHPDQTGWAQGAQVTATPTTPMVVGGITITNEPVSTITDINGYFELYLVKSAVYDVEIWFNDERIRIKRVLISQDNSKNFESYPNN